MCQRPGLAIRRPNPIEHALLEVPCRPRRTCSSSRATRGRAQRDSRDGKPAENMLRSRLSDRNHRLPHRARSPRKPSDALRAPEPIAQHSSERNIGRHMLARNIWRLLDCPARLGWMSAPPRPHSSARPPREQPLVALATNRGGAARTPPSARGSRPPPARGWVAGGPPTWTVTVVPGARGRLEVDVGVAGAVGVVGRGGRSCR